MGEEEAGEYGYYADAADGGPYISYEDRKTNWMGLFMQVAVRICRSSHGL